MGLHVFATAHIRRLLAVDGSILSFEPFAAATEGSQSQTNLNARFKFKLVPQPSTDSSVFALVSEENPNLILHQSISNDFFQFSVAGEQRAIGFFFEPFGSVLNFCCDCDP